MKIKLIALIILFSGVSIFYSCNKNDDSDSSTNLSTSCVLTKVYNDGVIAMEVIRNSDNIITSINNYDSAGVKIMEMIFEYSNTKVSKIKYYGTLLDMSKITNVKLPAEQILSSKVMDTVMYNEFFYENNKLIKKDLYFKDSITWVKSSYETYEYTLNNITKVNYNSSSGQYAYSELTYNSTGNVITDKFYYNMPKSGMLEKEYIYQYDEKNNGLFDPGIPLLETSYMSKNNILSETYKQYLFDGSFDTKITTYTYTYNESDYPITETETGSNGITSNYNLEYDCE